MTPSGLNNFAVLHFSQNAHIFNAYKVCSRTEHLW